MTRLTKICTHISSLILCNRRVDERTIQLYRVRRYFQLCKLIIRLFLCKSLEESVFILHTQMLLGYSVGCPALKSLSAPPKTGTTHAARGALPPCLHFPVQQSPDERRIPHRRPDPVGCLLIRIILFRRVWIWERWNMEQEERHRRGLRAQNRRFREWRFRDQKRDQGVLRRRCCVSR